MELRRILAGGFMVLVGAIAVGACGSSLESRCKTICENLAKCNAGQTCSCDSNNSNSCSNNAEIVDYLESCSAKPCGEQLTISGTGATGCLTTIPACKK